MGDTVDSITFDYWRWDKGYIYHVALDDQKGYISKKSLEGGTDSIQSSTTIPYEKVGNLYQQFGIFQFRTHAHLKQDEIAHLPYIYYDTEQFLRDK